MPRFESMGICWRALEFARICSGLCKMSLRGIPNGARAQAMSLGHVLTGCKRARVTKHLMLQCSLADALVFENILTVLQDTMLCVNITQVVLRAHSNLYEISVLVLSGHISMLQLSMLQKYNPARIVDIHVALHDASLCLVLSVCDEKRLVVCSHIDIVRICKRAKQ